MGLERSMNNHDKLGSGDIGNLALQLIDDIHCCQSHEQCGPGEEGTWGHMARFQMPAPPLNGHVTLGKSLNYSASVSLSVK